MGTDMTKQVMIVEDNELNMKLFRDLIEASGYKTSRPATAWKRWTLRASTARISS
jgi:CheY-like chemotaxis protein